MYLFLVLCVCTPLVGGQVYNISGKAPKKIEDFKQLFNDPIPFLEGRPTVFLQTPWDKTIWDTPDNPMSRRIDNSWIDHHIDFQHRAGLNFAVSALRNCPSDLAFVRLMHLSKALLTIWDFAVNQAPLKNSPTPFPDFVQYTLNRLDNITINECFKKPMMVECCPETTLDARACELIGNLSTVSGLRSGEDSLFESDHITQLSASEVASLQSARNYIFRTGVTRDWENLHNKKNPRIASEVPVIRFSFIQQCSPKSELQKFVKLIKNTWEMLKTDYSQYLENLWTALDDFGSLDEVVSSPSLSSDNRFDQVEVEEKWRSALNAPVDERFKPNFLSLFFEGLQTAGFTGMALSRTTVGAALSGGTALVGYAGQAGLLLSEVLGGSPSTLDQDETYWNKFREFNSKTGEQRCLGDEDRVFHIGYSLFENSQRSETLGASWHDSIMTVIMVPIGTGIVYEPPIVSCFDTSLKSLNVSGTSILKWEGRNDHINYWSLQNLEQHLLKHEELTFTCGTSPTLVVKKIKATGVKIPDPSSVLSCKNNPLNSIQWTSTQKCPIDPTTPIRGKTSCGQILASAKHVVETFTWVTMTDLVYENSVTLFDFELDKSSNITFDPNANVEDMSKCGTSKNTRTCVWPMVLWGFETKLKASTIEIGLGSTISGFEFRCPGNSVLHVPQTTSGLQWSVNEGNMIRIERTTTISTPALFRCSGVDFWTDGFLIKESSLDTTTTITESIMNAESNIWSFDGDLKIIHQTPPQTHNVYMTLDLGDAGTFTSAVSETLGISTTFRMKDDSIQCQLRTKLDYSKNKISCTGVNLDMVKKLSLNSNRNIIWETKPVRAPTPSPITPPKLLLGLSFWEKIIELNDLLDMTVMDFSEIVQKVAALKWPGEVFGTYETLYEDWEASKQAESGFRNKILDDLRKLHKKLKEMIDEKLGVNPTEYCCMFRENVFDTVTGFWDNDWTCTARLFTKYQGEICEYPNGDYCRRWGKLNTECLDKNGMIWPYDFLVHHDTVNQAEVLLDDVSEMVGWWNYWAPPVHEDSQNIEDLVNSVQADLDEIDGMDDNVLRPIVSLNKYDIIIAVTLLVSVNIMLICVAIIVTLYHKTNLGI